MTDSKISPVGPRDDVADENGDDADELVTDEHEGDEATVADTLEADEAEAKAEKATPSRPEGLASPHRRKIALVPLVVALVFFFSPAAAFVLGDRPEAIDNRPLAAMPSLGDGWSFFTDLNLWANDHLPLRSEAVEGGTELSEAVFDEPPPYGNSGTTSADGVAYPRVIDGEDGWLYFGGDVSGPCNPDLPLDQIMQSLQRLSTAVEASGRTMVLAVVPDKSTMVPEHLPGEYAGERCAAARKEAMWDALTSAGLPLLDVRAPMADAQELLDEPLYRPNDTHWNLRGASVFVQEVVNRIDPTLLAGGPSPFVEDGELDLPGDLSRMLGTPTTDPAVNVTVERPGVTLEIGGETIAPDDLPELGQAPATIDGLTTGAPLIPGRTALLGDSFSASVRPLIAPFFDVLTLQHNQSSPEALARTIVDSDTVVVEIVERSVAAGEVQLTTPAVIDVIEQTLASNPR